MKSYENFCGGKTLLLGAGDDLDQIPESHREIVTPAVRAVFQDPAAYFSELASRSQLPEFTRWLKEVTKSGKWTLVLDEAYMVERSTIAAFRWHSEKAISALVELPTETLPDGLPAEFQHFYSLVGSVRWEPLGHSGYLDDAQHPLLADYGMEPIVPGFSADRCRVWGCNAGGDMLIYNDQGRAAFLSHENLAIQALGTITDAINWAFRELTAGRRLDFDYQSATGSAL